MYAASAHSKLGIIADARNLFAVFGSHDDAFSADNVTHAYVGHTRTRK